MKRFITALLTAALCIGVFGVASAEFAPVIITKQAKWQTWGPDGAVGTKADTTNLDGAVQDTTEAIYIGDMAFGSTGLTVGPGAFTAMNALKVTIVATGVADNVDSAYYRVEHSPDGSHWTVPVVGNNLNTMTGVISGIDQGNAATGTTVNNCLSFFVKADLDVADGVAATGVISTYWAWAPFIRIIYRNMASDVFQGAKLFVSYPGFREVH